MDKSIRQDNILLSTRFLTSSKLGVIRAAQNGDTMALLWVLILCLCGLTGNGGHLLISGKYPHTINTLSLTTHVDAKIVKAAIDLYVSLGMMTISIDSDGRTVYTVTNWDQHQSDSAIMDLCTVRGITLGDNTNASICASPPQRERKEPKERETPPLNKEYIYKRARACVREDTTQSEGDQKGNERTEKVFVPPTLQQATEYYTGKGFHFGVQAFMSYYEDGWVVKTRGKNRPMKSWKMAMNTWQSTWRRDHPNWDWTPPTEEQIAAFVKKHSLSVDTHYFWHYYDVRGWMQGNHKMTDWEQVVRQWSKRATKPSSDREKPKSSQGFTGVRNGKRYINGYEQL